MSKTQCEKLLAALKNEPMTKVQMQRRLGILNGGGRIQDLKDRGINIDKNWIEVKTREGVSIVAQYFIVTKKRSKKK